jgi:hypothetical protein
MTAEVPEDTQQVEEAEEQKERRSIRGLLLLICTIVIIVLILLMLRGCGGGSETGGSGTRHIVPVEGYAPLPGLVSVWVPKSANVNVVLRRAGVRNLGILNLKNGRYVVTVPTGTEPAAISSLQAQPGVFDAGRVYRHGK